MGYEEIFPNKQCPQINDLIKDLSKKTIFFCLSGLNGMLYNKQRSIEVQAQIFSMIIERFSPDFKSYIVDTVNNYEKENPNLFFINNQTILEIAIVLIELEENPQAKELDEEGEVLLFKSILAANSKLNKEQNFKKLEGPQEYTDEIFYNILFPNFIHQAEFQNTNPFFIACTKAIYFFDFAINDPLFSSLIPYFCKRNEINDWKEYLNILLTSYISLMPKAGKMGGVLNLIEEGIKISPLLNKLSLLENTIDLKSIYTDSEILDYKIFREKPLFKLEEYQYAFINTNFFLDKLYQSIFFEFKDILMELPSEEFKKVTAKYPRWVQAKCFDSVKSYFSLNFSEKVLFYNTVKNIFNIAQAIHVPDDKENGMVDYYIRYGNKIFLLEFKDVGMNSKTKYSYSYETIKKDIKDKYCSQKKGVPQIVKAIEKLKSSDFSFEGLNTVKPIINEIEIYPILVFTDNTYNYNGMDRILMEEFRSQFKLSKIVNFSTYKKINDLAFINLNNLLEMESLLNSNKINLIELLENYYSRTFTLLQNPLRYSNELSFLTSFSSFSEISHHIIKSKNLICDVPILFKSEVKNIIKLKKNR